jgi:glycosyltransferase involved in cell wall biosynthesis
VRDGVTGRLFPSGDPGKLAVVAEEMWRDRELLKHLGRHARRMVEDEYSNACRLDRLTGTYEEVLGTGAAHRVPAGSAPVQALTL